MLPRKNPYTQQRGMEFHSWAALCLAMGVERYVEIGTNLGGSANFLYEAGIKNIVTLDVVTFTPSNVDRTPLLRPEVVFMLENGHDPAARERVLEHFGGLYPQAVFVDGDHEGEAPRLDFETWWPVTTTLMGFHDILEMPGVKSVWDEQKRLYKSLEITAQERWDQRETIPGSEIWGGIGVLFR